MASIHIGTSITTPGGKVYQCDGDTVTRSFENAYEATLTYKVAASGFGLDDLPARLDLHPTYTGLKLATATATREPGDIIAVTCSYKGGFRAYDGNSPADYEKSFEASASSEPIETNPYFIGSDRNNPTVTATELALIKRCVENNQPYTLALYPSGTTNGTVLWRMMMQGITSWNKVGGVYRVTRTNSQAPLNPKGVGYIVKTPPGAPSIPKTQNWLFTGYSWNRSGGLVTYTEEYTLSGPGGWEYYLYTKPTA